MFDRYTERAIQVIILSQGESRFLGHNYVGTEQILIGLIRQETGIAAKVLKSMGVNLKNVRTEVEKIIGRGSGLVALEIPFTPGTQRVLELAQEECKEMGDDWIGTEHLLLGLTSESKNRAVIVLETLGVDLTELRSQVVDMLGKTAKVDR
jgi:ATP-dependent Clp protease ATP-binding subunit ClpC